MQRPDKCVFCAIVAGEAEASVVHEDDRVVAFMDISPVTPGHVLVVPRRHVAGLEDLDEETSAHVWRTGHRVGRALRRSGLRCEGVNVFLADGEAAFQEVFHFHLHVFPRFAGDSFRISADWATRARALLDGKPGRSAGAWPPVRPTATPPPPRERSRTGCSGRARRRPPATRPR